MMIVVGLVFRTINRSILHDTRQLSQASLRELYSATEMTLDLQTCQTNVQELMEEYHRLIHGGADRNHAEAEIRRARQEIRKHLSRFERELETSFEATRLSARLAHDVGEAEIAEAEIAEIAEWLDQLKSHFKPYREAIDHLSRLAEHELEEADEYLEEIIEPLFREHLAPVIQAYREDSARELSEEAGNIERTLSHSILLFDGSTVIAVMLIIAISYLVGASISGPLMRLRAAAERVGAGNFDPPFPRDAKDAKDEIGYLTATFNQMVENLGDRTRQLIEAKHDLKMKNEELERLVEARTSELRKTNADLLLEVERRKEDQDKIRESLAEKEVMLKEIHHRVKNNMQVIASLLSLQSSALDNTEAVRALDDSRNRIYAMALVHEQLYASESFSKVDMNDYVRRLTSSLLRIHGDFADIDCGGVNDSLLFGIDTAIPCGLILNELVSNALKHAFADGETGNGMIGIHIERKTENSCTLVVADNGRGMPENFDIETSDSLGLKLVSNLAAQLGGSLEIERNNGAAVRITFPCR